MNGPTRTHVGRASRPPGREFQALAWTARHPGFVAVPLIVWGLALMLGPMVTAIVLGTLAGTLLFRERLSRINLLAIPLAIIAIALIAAGL